MPREVPASVDTTKPIKANEPTLILYYYPYSFYSQKVVMALSQMKIKYQLKYVDTHRAKQFSHPFLALNPKGEVPVLVDDVRVIPDSEKIIDYIQDNFANGNPGLLPSDREIRTRVEQLHQTIHSLKIESLSFGAAMFDDLGINPKPPYNCLTNRAQMKEYLANRPRILEAAARNFPAHADSINKKLQEVQEDSKIWKDREEYEGLLILFEKVLDECEAELASHDNPGWWLCSPEISLADIDLSVLLYRLWQLGFERRMWERQRPNIKRYFARVKMLDSFLVATNLKETLTLVEIMSNPVFLGIVGGAAVLACGYLLWNKKGEEISSALASVFSSDDGKGLPHLRPTRVVSMDTVNIPKVPPNVPAPVPITTSSARGTYARPNQFS